TTWAVQNKWGEGARAVPCERQKLKKRVMDCSNLMGLDPLAQYVSLNSDTNIVEGKRPNDPLRVEVDAINKDVSQQTRTKIMANIH
ncbi:hypothetical protein HAX54_051537, partial [Datura stramonium]|nr:hypothetical protein [Datura stramonium]